MRSLSGIVICLLISAAAAQEQAAVRFRFWKPIDRAAAKEDEIVAFAVDSDIYSATADKLRDVRVFDQDQVEAPYLIEPQVEHRQERTRQTFSMEIVTFRPNLDGNAAEIHLRLPENAPPAEGFSFLTPLKNYERKVRVSGSADGAKWQPLTEGLIFDYSQYMDVQSREFTLPKNNYREFKVTIADVTDDKESPFKELTRTFKDAKEAERVERTVIERRPFRIDSIGAWGTVVRERVEQAKIANYPVSEFESKEAAAKKQTVVTVHTNREPITRFTLETSSRNFSRHVVIEAPIETPPPKRMPGAKDDPEKQWQQVAEGTIEKIRFRELNREQLTITMPETRAEQFRIVIHNEDNPPLDITGVQAAGIVQHVVFLAQPGKTYRVYYGSEVAETPKYEAATVLATLRKEDTPTVVTLGKQVANKDFRDEPVRAGGGLFDNWIFLGTAIGLMVVVLGWCLFRAGTKLKDFPKE